MKNKLLTFEDDLKERLKNPAFKKAWEESEVEYNIAKQVIEKRLAKQLSQRQLAKKVKTTQAVISRIENMSVSPSVGMLQRIAGSLGKKLVIKFC